MRREQSTHRGQRWLQQRAKVDPDGTRAVWDLDLASDQINAELLAFPTERANRNGGLPLPTGRVPSAGSVTKSVADPMTLSPAIPVARLMDRFVLTARLKPDGRRRALALLAEHSAFGMELETYLDRHTIFLTETEVIFLFEGNGAQEAVRAVSTIQSSRRSSATGFRSSTDPFIKHKRRTPGAPRRQFDGESWGDSDQRVRRI
jgi:hypothetical protein